MLKRFLLFFGPQYDPCGGWEEFIKSYDTLEESIAKGEDLIVGGVSACTFYHVVDTTLAEDAEYPEDAIVAKGRSDRES